MDYITGISIITFMGSCVYIARFWIALHYAQKAGLADKVYQLEQMVKEINNYLIRIREQTGLGN